MKRLVWISSGLTFTAVTAFVAAASPQWRSALTPSADETVFEVPTVSDRISTAYRGEGRTAIAEVSVATVTPFGEPEGTRLTAEAGAPVAPAGVGHGALEQVTALAAGGGATISFSAESTRAAGRDLIRPVRSEGGEADPDAADDFHPSDRSAGWASGELQDNPLVGSAYRSDGEEMSRSEFLGEARGARYVLLGEVHDNPDHHRIQADIIGGLARLGARPEIVFEMIPQSFSDTLRTFDRMEPGDLAAFGEALDWEARGWPAFTTYEPIFDVALRNDLPIHAGDLDREIIASIAREGADTLEPREVERLGLARPLAPDTREAIVEEMHVSHCGLMPEAALAGMVDAQRARDGALAAALREAVEAEGSAVLIAGAGHVRNDRAVPHVLAESEPDASTLSVRLVEVREDETATGDYGVGSDEPAPYDVTIFTPRTERPDPCEALRERMGQ